MEALVLICVAIFIFLTLRCIATKKTDTKIEDTNIKVEEMKNEEKTQLEQNLEQLRKLEKEVADGMLEESWIKPGDVIEFGFNQLVGVLESKVVFREDGTPDINLNCCEFTRASFLDSLTSDFTTVYTLSSLVEENVKIIGKFTFEKSDTNIVKLLTMTIDRKED